MAACTSIVWRAATSLLLIAATALPLTPAFAEWSADVTRDATGQVKVAMTADVEGGRSIYATCDASRNTILALLVPPDPTLPATGLTLSFTFPDGSHWASHAALYRYDNEQVAVGYGNADDVPAIVAAVAAATGDIRITVDTPTSGVPRSYMADTRGSTNAARKFLDNCFPSN